MTVLAVCGQPSTRRGGNVRRTSRAITIQIEKILLVQKRIGLEIVFLFFCSTC